MRAKFNIALFWLAHPAFLYFADFEIVWVSVGLLWSWLVFVVGLQIGAHRYFTHSAFTTGPRRAAALNFLALLGGMGTPQDWMVAHIAHHKYADGPKDPTNWRVIGLWKNYSSLWQLDVPVTQGAVRLVVRSLRSPVSQFLYAWYVYVVAAWGLAISTLGASAFAWLFLLPVLVGHWGMNLLNHIGHAKGCANTSRFFNLVTPGDGYHAFHHQHPGEYRFGRVDALAWIIEATLISPRDATRGQA